MKLSKIAKLCVRAKRVYLYEDEARGVQWIGDGYALYPLYMMPDLSPETVLRVLDVKEKDWSKIAINTVPLPGSLDLADGTDEDKLLPPPGLSIGYAGEVLEPARFSCGLRFVNPLHLAPVEDQDQLMLYERESTDGEPYIVAKTGLMVQAVIMPRLITDEELLNRLQTLAAELGQTIATHGDRTAAEDDKDYVNRGWCNLERDGLPACEQQRLPWATDDNGEVI